METNPEYVKIYLNYLLHTRIKNGFFIDKNLLGIIKKILPEDKVKILDLACGPRQRIMEFINWFLPEKCNTSLFGYDKNIAWRTHWLNNLPCLIKEKIWLNSMPNVFKGDILHCSHAIYMPDVKESLFRIWEKSPDLKLMAIRALAEDSVFNLFTSAWGITDNHDWEKLFLQDLKYKGLKLIGTVYVPTTLEVTNILIPDLAQWIKSFVVGSGDIKIAIDIIREYQTKKRGNAVLNTSDIFYIVTR